MNISLISALSKPCQGLSFQGKIPWYIPEDLTNFRYKTLDHIVVMGFSTFQNDLKFKPLKGRVNVVLTRRQIKDPHRPKQQLYYTAETDLEKIVELVQHDIDYVGICNPFIRLDPVYIIGGQSVFEQYIDQADTLYLTEIENDVPCDRFFPDYTQFKEEFSTGLHHHDEWNYRFKVYKR